MGRDRAVALVALAFLLVGCGQQPLKHAAVTQPSPTPTSPLQASANAFHSGEVGAAYTPVALAASGGVAPYTWSVAQGGLPDGLSIAPDGTVSGTPARPGNYSFTIQVTDSRGSTAEVNGTIDVAQALNASLLSQCSDVCQVEVGCLDVCGTFGTVGGGTPPYTYRATGNVPPGVQLSSSSLSYVGMFSQSVSNWRSTVTVTDAFGETATVSPVFNVYPHISAVGENVNFQGDGGWVIVRYSGGYGVPDAVITDWTWSGALCPYNNSVMPVINQVGDGMVKILVIPAPQTSTTYVGSFRVLVTDQSTCGAGVRCSAYASAAFQKHATGCS